MTISKMAFLRIYRFLILSFIFVLAYAEDECTMKSSCICIFPNGTGIDLTPAVRTSFYTAQVYDETMKSTPNSTYMELTTYYYHPCFDSQLNMTIPPKAKTTCDQSLTICRHVRVMRLENEAAQNYTLSNNTYDFLGKAIDSTFSSQGNSIIYKNGPSQTTVLLECSQSDNQFQVYSTDEPAKLVLAFYSKDACLKQIEDIGRSAGSTLLIIFFSLVIFYLVLGICTKKFLMGATGVEVIPNLGFWSDIPNLVKDGWLFMINGFRLPARASGQTVSPDPNSYDSI